MRGELQRKEREVREQRERLETERERKESEERERRESADRQKETKATQTEGEGSQSTQKEANTGLLSQPLVSQSASSSSANQKPPALSSPSSTRPLPLTTQERVPSPSHSIDTSIGAKVQAYSSALSVRHAHTQTLIGPDADSFTRHWPSDRQFQGGVYSCQPVRTVPNQVSRPIMLMPCTNHYDVMSFLLLVTSVAMVQADVFFSSLFSSLLFSSFPILFSHLSLLFCLLSPLILFGIVMAHCSHPLLFCSLHQQGGLF